MDIEEDSLTKVIKQSQCVFKGGRFDVFAIELPSKSQKVLKKEFVVHPGAVVILPVMDDNQVIMIKNDRFAVGQELWELPAGTLESGEQPEQTAYRELIEETGYQATRIQPLTKFFTSPGFCNEKMHAYLAKDLHFVGQKLDEGEKIKVEILTWEKIDQMIRAEQIQDGKTLATLLFYKLLYRKITT